MRNNTHQTSLTPNQWPIRAVIWLAVVVIFCLMLKYDVWLMRFRYWLIPDKPDGMVKQIIQGFREFAQIMPIVVACIMVALCDKPRRRRVITAVIVAQLLAGVAYNAGKYTIVRYRPDAMVGKLDDLNNITPAQTWVGLQPVNKDMKTQSFPSGHSAAAFALAGVLAWYYPPLRGLLWTLAAGCAFSRYLDLRHWPSDCLAGATIGYLAAWLSLHLFKRGCKQDVIHQPGPNQTVRL